MQPKDRRLVTEQTFEHHTELKIAPVRRDAATAATQSQQALVASGTAVTDSSSALTRVKQLETMAGLEPGEVTDAQTANLIQQAESLTREALDSHYVRGVNVTAYGATGDGVTNDTPAFQEAIDTANGATVHVPAGQYVLNGLVVTGLTRLSLDDGAVLVHEATDVHAQMISFQGTGLRIRGGTIDGQQRDQDGLTRVIYGRVPSGAVIDIEGVHFKSPAHTCVGILEFGGYFNFSHNTITDQKQHDGTPGRHTTIATIGSGEESANGLIRTNHNRAIFDDTPWDDGTNPGGFFAAVNGFDDTGGGGPLTPGFANGNMSTWEATGNYFYGYGQHYSVNDISPLHTYPSIAGARWTNNLFVKCGFSAISAKSVQDFVFTGNVIKDGEVSEKNTSTEGAIAYLPGYQASFFDRPRAVISNNIVTNPGGSTDTNRQACITVSGTDESIARNVVISGNVLEGGGHGIRLHYASEIVISGNDIKGGTTSTTNSDAGIACFNTSGTVTITGNRVETSHGRGLQMLTGDDVDLKLSGNTWTQKGQVHALDIRGADSLSVVGDSITAPSAGLAWMIRASSTSNLGHLHWSDVQFDALGNTLWAGIDAASGKLVGNNSPENIISASEAGTLYQQLNADGAASLWVANSPGDGAWTQLGGGSGGAPAPATANRLLGYNYDPVMAVSAQDAANSGEIWLAKVQLGASGRIGRIRFSVTAGGTGLANSYVGVYNLDGQLLATSNDISSTLGSGGNKFVDVTDMPVMTAGTEVLVAMLWNGTQGPTLRGVSGSGIADIGIIQTAERRFAVTGTGLTALPATLGARRESKIQGWIGLG